mmetsp:Transcript_30526/g.52241  ORF Transcript_30526/g.52241 Transcript_30526/m.52241 type:complete len:219 (+) Transcript_30526:109-765(+)
MVLLLFFCARTSAVRTGTTATRVRSTVVPHRGALSLFTQSIANCMLPLFERMSAERLLEAPAGDSSISELDGNPALSLALVRSTSEQTTARQLLRGAWCVKAATLGSCLRLIPPVRTRGERNLKAEPILILAVRYSDDLYFAFQGETAAIGIGSVVSQPVSTVEHEVSPLPLEGESRAALGQPALADSRLSHAWQLRARGSDLVRARRAIGSTTGDGL